MSADTAPAWLPRTTVGLGLAGLATSIYLAIEHITASSTLACPENSTVSCLKVTSSPQSVLLGIPLPYLGLVFFAAIVYLGLPSRWADPALRQIRLGATAVGVVMVFYLVYVELFTVDAICLWCTVVHALTVALFAVVCWGSAITARL